MFCVTLNFPVLLSNLQDINWLQLVVALLSQLILAVAPCHHHLQCADSVCVVEAPVTVAHCFTVIARIFTTLKLKTNTRIQ